MIFVNQTWWDKYIDQARQARPELDRAELQVQAFLPIDGGEFLTKLDGMADGFIQFPLTLLEVLAGRPNLGAMLNFTFAKRIPDEDVQWLPTPEPVAEPEPEPKARHFRHKGKRG